MPAVRQDAYTSGRLLFNSNLHRRTQLVGLSVDNQGVVDQKIELYDGFTTTASKTNAAGATQAAEDFTTDVLSGKRRLQITVPVGQFVSLEERALKEVTFLGKAWVVASTTTSDCVVVAQYKHV